MSETLDVTSAAAPKRPAFLTVLCILTFIGAGLGIIFGIYNVITVPAQIQAMKGLVAMAEGFGPLGAELKSQVASLEKFGFISAILSLVGSLLALFGAIKMWKLSKAGFFIYLLGQILALVGIFLISGTSFLAGPIGMIFPILFIVLYALNLKHLK